ncbi:MAG: CPBP family glutamic-type intramembrane protease [Geobacteraceae bacterium]
MFGLEHNLFLAGIMAGIAYNLLLYRTKSLSACILAHGLTNLALGIYVLQTGKWYFW